MNERPHLERVLSLPVLILYGLGTTVGAGIYALIGEVAGRAGMWAPVAFLVAAGMASLTALSFCELSARLPRAGGEAVYVGTGLRSPRLAVAVGMLVAVIGCLSAATVARAIAGYLDELVPVAAWLGILILVIALGALAAWGITEAAWAAASMTVIEVGALIVVIVAGGEGLADVPAQLGKLIPPLRADAWQSIGSASLLCFYAFLGFEDMVNVAEEVKDVERVLPQAILATLACTVVIYLLLTLVVVQTVSPEEIAASRAPLAYLWGALTGGSTVWISIVGVLAMTNGALIQVIKASRILYGLADQGQLPKVFAEIHPRRHTPVMATVVVTVVVGALALSLPTGRLAETTSAATMGVFALTNLSLFVLKLREPNVPGGRSVPLPVPLAGFVICSGFLILDLIRRL
jgi:amino acid transporter